MDKIELERFVLELAKPLLKELYGNFSIDPDQKDSPDASIILESSNRQIGIEITSVDKSEALQYFNDEKVSKPIELEQLDALLNDGSYSGHPMRKMSIEFPRDYLYENIIKKKAKFSRYSESGDYDELIILAFSSYMRLDHKDFNDYFKPWTEYLLSKEHFPFVKVIFVCTCTRNSITVYEKEFPRRSEPKLEKNKELGITVSQSPMLPIGKTVNLFDILEQSPSVSKPSKSRRKQDKKEKRKASKKANNINLQ